MKCLPRMHEAIEGLKEINVPKAIIEVDRQHLVTMLQHKKEVHSQFGCIMKPNLSHSLARTSSFLTNSHFSLFTILYC
ncbi:hypothetical protein JHK82_045611 [Glycine max]|uniref:Uncharacterized protein n=2 Tax=Glycine subgen. Soja TaxID=1462606 RepID=A0A0R0G2S8_SOYBN|nr:hypothetical protein JHK86_046042 [Glycine max]KAG4941938.1 hypothetical protein JHK87_045809 [Glycine soja]KAG4952715.1 hypothetical protein JHK85_046582 [Glycine max]KAG5100559.1 hypothetical protein JHK82_045611 [Glycine max]KAG5109143.1 hypothetical protein JHK84_046050 [Glycine max]